MRYVRPPNRYVDISVCDFIINMKKKINTCQKGKLIMRKKEISMIILAGGASSRMGRDKSDLTIDGKTFLEMQIEKGEKLGISDILLSGYHGENKYKYPIIPDRFPGKGLV